MRQFGLRGGAMLSAVLAATATGAPYAEAQKTNASARPLDAIYACASVAEAGARLACFDEAAAKVRSAEAKGDLFVVTRREQEEAATKSFGLGSAPALASRPAAPPPSAAAAAPSAPARPASPPPAPPAPLKRVTLKIASFSIADGGRYRFKTDDGQEWLQIDDERVRLEGSGPWTGEVRKAALGSFFMNIDGQRSVRVTRTR